MIINHNLSALNTHRQLGVNTGAASKALEKLSSGLRINRAADDAAGLAISEKMRGQIRGLEQAQRNAQDSISLIQTAEGALNESHAILQRMRELAVQSANDTNTAEDRLKLQAEIDQLAEELTRIADTTEFNTQKLLNGTFEGTFHIGANATQNITLQIGNMDATSLKVAGSEAAEVEQQTAITAGEDAIAIEAGTYSVVSADNYEGTPLVDGKVSGSDATKVSHVMVGADGQALATSIDGGKTWQQYADANQVTFKFDGAVVDGGSITIGTGTATATVGITNHNLAGGTYTVVSVASNPSTGSFNVGLADSQGNIVALGATNTSGTAADNAAEVTHWVSVNDTSEVLLQTTENKALATGDTIKVSGKGVDISTQASADAAITTINNALETVSAQRSALGAVQNRLEHTINNLGAAAENLTAAESRIRDVDMAKEIMEFTKNNILTQAAQAMLAQANQQPQGVLQLLR